MLTQITRFEIRSPAVRSDWLRRSAPRINTTIPHSAHRAATAALRAVDRDIELHGSVTWETVELVRSTLALLRVL